MNKHSTELSKSVKIWLQSRFSMSRTIRLLLKIIFILHFFYWYLWWLQFLTAWSYVHSQNTMICLSNFESLPWKFDNRYCHKMGERLNIWGHFSIYLQWSSHHDLYKNSSPLWKSDVNSQFHMLPIGSWLKEKFVKM